MSRIWVCNLTEGVTGPDCIPSFILKSAADELAPILTQLYQYSLAEGEIPSDWRDAHIVRTTESTSFSEDFTPSRSTSCFRLLRKEDIQASMVPSTPKIATNQRHVIPTQYTLHGHTLEVVDSAKYLGVTISEDLQWSKHIDTVTKNDLV
jgi:hypothetical protein